MRYDYDLVVIGGGAAGLTGAGLGASLGAKTLLVEREKLGGDCTWTGCVPSKALLHAAGVAHAVRTAGRVGVRADEPDVDFGAVMDRLRRVRQGIYEEADAPPRLASFGVETAAATARFADPHTLALDGPDGEGQGGARRVTFRYALVVTGSRPAVPDVPGLDGVGALTNETVFDLTERPGRLAVLGAGPIGTELAQAFVRLGSRVTVVDRGDRILPRDDAELAGMLRGVLEAEGVTYRLGATVERAERAGGEAVLHLAGGEAVRADAVLVAAGRRPRVDTAGLDAAGVRYTEKGIEVDAHGRTSQPHVYAAGDVTGGPQFTHWCEHTAKIAVLHALAKLPGRVARARLPWVTYTDPELAHVGATEAELRERGTPFETYRFPYDRLDRALTDDATTGLVKVFARPLDGRIYGASVLGARAGELITTYAVALTHGVTLRGLADTLIPYPTYGLGARRAADQWYAQKQSPGLVRFVQRLFGYRGPVVEPEPGRIV